MKDIGQSIQVRLVTGLYPDWVVVDVELVEDVVAAVVVEDGDERQEGFEQGGFAHPEQSDNVAPDQAGQPVVTVEWVAETPPDGRDDDLPGGPEPRHPGQGGGDLGTAPTRLHAVLAEDSECEAVAVEDVHQPVVDGGEDLPGNWLRSPG